MIERDDDQLWLEALAGRAAGDSPPQREASALRRAVIERETDVPVVAERDRDPAREGRLLDRARREGVLGKPRAAPHRRWWIGWDSGFAVAAIAGIALAIGFYQLPTRESQVVRSAPDGVVRLEADDPAGLKQQIIDELRAIGVAASGYERLGRHGIDADLPQPVTDAVRRVLARHRIPLPADGVLRVEIAPRETT